MNLDVEKFYIKIIVLDVIYNLVVEFFILNCLGSKKYSKFMYFEI
jgi:hypothetical protein